MKKTNDAQILLLKYSRKIGYMNKWRRLKSPRTEGTRIRGTQLKSATDPMACDFRAPYTSVVARHLVKINITKSFSPVLYTRGDYYIS